MLPSWSVDSVLKNESLDEAGARLNYLFKYLEPVAQSDVHHTGLDLSRFLELHTSIASHNHSSTFRIKIEIGSALVKGQVHVPIFGSLTDY